MLSLQFCKKQIKRMAGLNGYPRLEAAAENEMALALSNAHNDDMAVTLVSDCVNYGRDCPKPADIRRAIWEANEKLEPRPKPPVTHSHCAACQDFGFYGGFIGTNHDGPWIVCTCSAGRSAEARRKVDQANAARDKIMSLGPSLLAKFKLLPHSIDDDYRGEF